MSIENLQWLPLNCRIHLTAMNANKWIRRTGIACTVTGSMLLLEAIISIALTTSGKASLYPDRGFHFWDITYPLIGLLYFVAAVVYLLKKPYSVKLMLLALSLTILHSFIILLIHHYTNTVSGVNLPSYIGVAFHVVLFASVYRFKNDYYLSPEALETRYGKITPYSKRAVAVMSIAGIVCVCIPLGLIALWAEASQIEGNRAAQVAWFKNQFPEFLRAPFRLNYISMLASMTGIYLSSKGIGKTASFWKYVNYPVMVFAIILLLLDIFQLM